MTEHLDLLSRRVACWSRRAVGTHVVRDIAVDHRVHWTGKLRKDKRELSLGAVLLTHPLLRDIDLQLVSQN